MQAKRGVPAPRGRQSDDFRRFGFRHSQMRSNIVAARLDETENRLQKPGIWGMSIKVALASSEHCGGCHCGNLRVRLRLTQAPADVRLRACGCSFCRAHNTRTTSDPQGSVDISADNWSLVQSYRFGTGTAEYVICRNCGVYIGALGETETGIRAVINITCLDDREQFTREPVPVDHDGEASGDRLARRAANWTPATVHR